MNPDEIAKKYGATFTPAQQATDVAKKYGATFTATGTDKVGDFITSQGSYKDQKAKIASGDAGVIGSAFSGAPLAPASKEDVTNKTNPLALIGKTVANVASDLPSIIKGAADMVVHPIDSIKGMANYYKDIATESLNAIAEGAKTGDWKRVQEDIQKATVSMIDHPLQTIAAFEGAKGGFEAIKDPKGFAESTTNKTTKVLDKGQEVFNNIKKPFQDKMSFTTDSALHKQTLTAAENIGQQVESQKTIADLQKEIDSMTKKSVEETQKKTGEVKAKEGEVQQKTLEQKQKELELESKKRELADLNKAHKQTVADASDSVKADTGSNGFPSLKTMQDNISGFFKMAKEKIGQGYEENLGNAKINLDKVFSGIDKFQSYLRGISDKKTLTAIEPFVKSLKNRELSTKFADDPKGLEKHLGQQGIPDSAENFMKENPPLTSENIKGTKKTILESIRENNKDALKNYDTNVESAFKESFKDAIKDEYGQDTLDRLDATDKKWSELMKNPLVNDEAPSLDSIQKNWDSLKKNASQFPEGMSLMEKIQNYAGNQILEKAKQANGTYSVTEINNGLKKYGTILGDEVKSKLQSVINLNNTLTEGIVKAKDAVETKQTEVKNTKESVKSSTDELKNLEKEQKKVIADAKSIGSTPDEIIRKIKDIKSIEEMNKFLKDTGKTVDQLRPVLVQAIIEKADPKILEDKSAPFDVEKTSEIIKQLKDIGKSEDGIEWKKVNDEILGKDGIKLVKDLEKKFDEYKKLTDKDFKKKTMVKRVLEGAFGALLLAMGHQVWGSIEIFRSLKGKSKVEEPLSGRERPSAEVPKSKVPRKLITKKRAVISGVNAASKNDKNNQE